MMVRSPGSGSLWNWSLVGDLRRLHAGGGPARVPIRFPRYPVFKVPGASYPPRPAASFRPRRKEIYYAHHLPRSRGNPAFFPGRGALRAVFAVRPGAMRFDCPSCPAHIPSISPGKTLGGENATLHLGALRRRGLPAAEGFPPPYGDAPCYAKRPGDSRCARPLR